MSKSVCHHADCLEAIVKCEERIKSFYKTRQGNIGIKASNYFSTLMDIFSPLSVDPEISEKVAEWCTDLITSWDHKGERMYDQLAKTFCLPEVDTFFKTYPDDYSIISNALDTISNCVIETNCTEIGGVIAGSLNKFIVNHEKEYDSSPASYVFSKDYISMLNNTFSEITGVLNYVAEKTHNHCIVQEVAELFPLIAYKNYFSSVCGALHSLTDLVDSGSCKDLVSIVNLYKDETDLVMSVSEKIDGIAKEILALKDSDKGVELIIADSFNLLYTVFDIFKDEELFKLLTSFDPDRKDCVHDLALYLAFDVGNLEVTTKATEFLNTYSHVDAIKSLADMIEGLNLESNVTGLDAFIDKFNLPETVSFLSKYDEGDITNHFSGPLYTMFVEVLEGSLNSTEKISRSKAAIALLDKYSSVSLDYLGILDATALDRSIRNIKNYEIDLGFNQDTFDLIVSGFSLPEVVDTVTSYELDVASNVANTIKVEIFKAGFLGIKERQPVDFSSVKKLCGVLSNTDLNEKIMELYGDEIFAREKLAKCLLKSAKSTKDLEATNCVADLLQKSAGYDSVDDMVYLIETLNPTESSDVVKNAVLLLSESKYTNSDLKSMGITYKKVIERDTSPELINKVTSFFEKYIGTAALVRFSEKVRNAAQGRRLPKSISNVIDLLSLPEVNKVIKGQGGLISNVDTNVAAAIAEAACRYEDEEAVKDVCQLMERYQTHDDLYEISKLSFNISQSVFDPRVPKMVKKVLNGNVALTDENIDTIKGYACEIFAELGDTELAYNLPLGHMKNLVRAYRIVESTCQGESKDFDKEVRTSFLDVLNLKISYGASLQDKKDIVQEWSTNVYRLVRDNPEALRFMRNVA